MLLCKGMWKNKKLKRCAAHSPLIFGMTKALLIFLGTCFVQIKAVFDLLHVHKTTFQTLGRRNYQSLHCSSTCQLRNIPAEQQTFSFFLMFGQGIHIFEETQKSIEDVIGDVYCPTIPTEKCVYLSTNKTSSFLTLKSAKPALACWMFLLWDEKATIMLIGVDRTHCFLSKTSRDYGKREPTPFFKEI